MRIILHLLLCLVSYLLVARSACTTVHVETPPTTLDIHQVAGSQRLLYGPAPASAKDFAALAARGVKRIISVDGATPNVSMALDHGLSYVHIPIGYDGVPIEAQASLVKAVHETGAAVFIHCHHGRHRAPAAASIPFMALENANHATAKRLLEKAGTSKNYAGLWNSVATFDLAAIKGMKPQLVASADVEPLVSTMAKLGHHWDSVKESAQNSWESSGSGDALAPSVEALLLLEAFREIDRMNKEAAYAAEMAEATGQANLLYTALIAKDYASANQAYHKLRVSCSTCHRAHRD